LITFKTLRSALIFADVEIRIFGKHNMEENTFFFLC